MKTIFPIKPIFGDFTVPPDKSISHRAVIFASLARGKSKLKDVLLSKDCRATIRCLKALGVRIKRGGYKEIIIHGRGRDGLKEPLGVLDAGNSGTTMRLLSGILAAQPFFSVFTGDKSLRNRPMKRIIDPLTEMGAHIYGRNGNKYPPLAIVGGNLKGIKYKLPIPSAQVKSCLLLASIYAKGVTIIEEPIKSRDHTERMMEALGMKVYEGEGKIASFEGCEVPPFETWVPGDISSASFLITAGLIVPESRVSIHQVGLNPTRIGFINAVARMGADIKIREMGVNELNEPFGEVHVKFGELHGIEIGGDEIPLLIDEIPLIAILGARAKGITKVSGAKELRLKESDRIARIVSGLRSMKVEIEEKEDGFVIEGVQNLRGAIINPRGDHRIAMTFAIAGLIARGHTVIMNPELVEVSYPEFWDLPIWSKRK